MDFLAELNPAQQEAVTSIEGPVLALAGPGSGKTRALTYRIAYLIAAARIAPWQIMAVTFTNKAAREMKSRLEGLLAPEQVNRLSVGTFHALCARLLRREIETLGYYSRDFVIYDVNDQQAVVKRALVDLNLDDKRWKPASINYAISNAKNELITPDKFPTRTYEEEVMARVYERYQQMLVESNAMDFDDLLLVTHQLFRRHESILEKYQQHYRHILVDEFQDTNMVQYELARMLAGGYRQIFVVGDLDQGVYSWRGADYRNVLRFRDDYPDHKLILLSQNYRSTETILKAARELIRKNQHRIENELFTRRGKGPKIRVVEAYSEQEEAGFVVDEIRRLEAAGQCTLGEMAVMYRINAQSRILEETFIGQGVPYLLVRGTRFYDRKEIKDALAYLRLIHNPEDSVSLARIINVPPRGIGGKTLADLSRWAFETGLTPWQAFQQVVVAEEGGEETNQAENDLVDMAESPFKTRARKALVEFGRVMNMLIRAKQKLTLPELFDLMLARTGYKGMVKDDTPEGEDRWENLMELRRVTEQFRAVDGREALAQFLEDVALVSDVDALNEEGTAPALLTLHTAKGLEFATVFIVGMEEGLFPHSRSLDDPEELEEERRLAYVGITRAKDRLYLMRSFRRYTYGMEEPTLPSRFLKELPPELLEDSPVQAPHRKTASSEPNRGGLHQAAQQVSRLWNRAGSARSEPARAARYKIGDVVYHDKFGQGTVIAVEVERDDELIQIAFPDQGIKKLSANVAPLEKRS